MYCTLPYNTGHVIVCVLCSLTSRPQRGGRPAKESNPSSRYAPRQPVGGVRKPAVPSSAAPKSSKVIDSRARGSAAGGGRKPAGGVGGAKKGGGPPKKDKVQHAGLLFDNVLLLFSFCYTPCTS